MKIIRKYRMLLYVVGVFFILLGVVLSFCNSSRKADTKVNTPPPEHIMDTKYLVAEYEHTNTDFLKIYQKDDIITLYSYCPFEWTGYNPDVYEVRCNEKISKNDIEVTWEDFMGNPIPDDSDEGGMVLVKIIKSGDLIYGGEHDFLTNKEEYAQFKDGLTHYNKRQKEQEIKKGNQSNNESSPQTNTN